MKKLCYSFLLACLFAFSVTATALPKKGNEPVAQSQTNVSEINWLPKVDYSSITLTVSTPDGDVYRKEFVAGATISFSVVDDKGQPRPDGSYIYELRVTPVIDSKTKGKLARARENGDDKEVAREMRSRGYVPKEEVVQSGAFSIMKGAVVMGTDEEKFDGQGSENGGNYGGILGMARSVRSQPQTQTVGGLRLMPASARSSNFGYVKAYPATAALLFDQVFADDLIVQGSGCIGLDCVNNEDFGFDTIRMKENNLRIKFEDTSTGSFPSVDWQLVANDSNSGGMNRFSIEDVSNGKTPFTVTANAPNNSIFVDSSGRIGRNTSTPVLDFHDTSTNTPALRLEQTSAGGFSAQTWDIGANESNFFIRDVTNGSLLSFRIKPGAPKNSLFIGSNGAVGLGTETPSARLDVAGNVLVQGSIEVWDNPFSLAKRRGVNTKSVLDKLSRVSITSSGSGSSTDLKPNFQELGAEFGVGNNGRVSLLDIDAINMAAIKAVHQILVEKDAQIAELQTQLAAIEQRLKALETGSKR